MASMPGQSQPQSMQCVTLVCIFCFHLFLPQDSCGGQHHSLCHRCHLCCPDAFYDGHSPPPPPLLLADGQCAVWGLLALFLLLAAAALVAASYVKALSVGMFAASLVWCDDMDCWYDPAAVHVVAGVLKHGCSLTQVNPTHRGPLVHPPFHSLPLHPACPRSVALGNSIAFLIFVILAIVLPSIFATRHY